MDSIEIINSELFRIDKSCTLIIKCDYVNFDYAFNNQECNILIFNDNNDKVFINETGYLNDSTVRINYLDLNRKSLVQNTKIDINSNSNLIVNSTYLGIDKKNIVYDLFNKGNDSNIEITNNIVCVDDADFSLDCIGTIVKGAKRSKCHQKSHCLTIGNPKKARVLPILNIDENDVEASHSLSSGTLDEEVLFYINSRGLSSNEALSLILKSYLIPNDDYYENFIDGAKIKDLAINKVEDICSM